MMIKIVPSIKTNLSRKKIVEEIKLVISNKQSNLDKILIIKSLIDNNFKMKEADWNKALPPEFDY